jgi:hypothetical protein
VIVPGRRFGAFVVANGGSSRFGATARDAIVAAALPARAMTPPEPTPTVSSPMDPTGSYRLTRYAHRGVENLPALFNGQLHVSRSGGDTIEVSGLGDANGRYVPVTTDRWRKVDGTDVVAVRTKDGAVTHFFGSQSFFGTRFPSAYERLAWYDEPRFLNEALSYTVALPLLGLLAWPVVAAVLWLMRRRRPVAYRGAARASGWPVAAVAAAVASAALALWFGFGFIAASNRAAERGGGELIYGLSPSMRLLAWAPSLLTALGALLLIAAIIAWRRRWWSMPGRLIYTVIVVNLALFAVLLVRWGYFPLATG